MRYIIAKLYFIFLLLLCSSCSVENDNLSEFKALLTILNNRDSVTSVTFDVTSDLSSDKTGHPYNFGFLLENYELKSKDSKTIEINGYYDRETSLNIRLQGDIYSDGELYLNRGDNAKIELIDFNAANGFKEYLANGFTGTPPPSNSGNSGGSGSGGGSGGAGSSVDCDNIEWGYSNKIIQGGEKKLCQNSA